MSDGSGRIVVGVDGSSGGRAALAFALQDAPRRDAAVHVVVAFATAETLAALCDPRSDRSPPRARRCAPPSRRRPPASWRT
ncbi:MAG: hypothetical protein QOI36_1283 [Pseudonocardiales bacterium]|nr:hypothetical protein [Pseudonocardiales bacterium]